MILIFAFEKAFNAGDLDTLLKLYDEQSVLLQGVHGVTRSALLLR
jgi:hypothetical protein